MAWAMAFPLGAELLRVPPELLEGVMLRAPSLRGVVALPPPDSREGTSRRGSIARLEGTYYTQEQGGGTSSLRGIDSYLLGSGCSVAIGCRTRIQQIADPLQQQGRSSSFSRLLNPN